jgi:hypothetical protein
VISVFGALVSEKNKYDSMVRRNEQYIVTLNSLVERVKNNQSIGNIQQELAAIENQSRSLEQVLAEIEELDDIWSASVDQLDKEQDSSFSEQTDQSLGIANTESNSNRSNAKFL